MKVVKIGATFFLQYREAKLPVSRKDLKRFRNLTPEERKIDIRQKIILASLSEKDLDSNEADLIMRLYRLSPQHWSFKIPDFEDEDTLRNLI